MKTSDMIREAVQFPGETEWDAFVNDNSLDIVEEDQLRQQIPSADTREAFNKFNPVELLSQLLSVLADQGLDDAVNAVKKITPVVNHAWTHRTKGSVIARVRRRVAELEPGPSVPVKDKLRDFFRNNPYPDDSRVHKLAEELQMSPHDLETEIYSLLSDKLKENP